MRQSIIAAAFFVVLLICACAPLQKDILLHSENDEAKDIAKPSEETLRARIADLYQAAYEGDKSKVTKFFPGGEFPGGKRHSWNRQRIWEIMEASGPKEQEMNIVYLKVDGNYGYVIWLPGRKLHHLGCQDLGGDELCWRWMGGTWYVVNSPCWNKNESELVKWEAFLKAQQTEACWQDAGPLLREMTRQFVENLRSNNLDANCSMMSDYSYYHDYWSSWLGESYKCAQACRISEWNYDINAYDIDDKVTCTKVPLYSPLDTQLSNPLRINLYYVIVRLQDSYGNKRILRVEWVRENASYKIWE